MATGGVTASAASGAVPAASGTSATGGGLSFRSFLSDINPLQYIPVVGAVYRAVTGDEGNSTLRFVASLGTGFALGGPVGVGITVAEKVTGIDPERIARTLLGRLLHHAPAATAAAATTAKPEAETATTGGTTTATAGADAAGRPWSAAELSAYAAASGSIAAGGAGTDGTVTADTLNAMELRRVDALYA